MASIFRDPIVLIFVDADNVELARITNPGPVPRVGENVLLTAVPYLVERVGYDYPGADLERIWVVVRPA